MVLNLFAPIISQPLAVKQQYTCEYITSDNKGNSLGKRVVSGTITSDSHKQIWSGVKMVRDSAAAEPMSYMDGFTYDPSDKALLTNPATFKNLPSTAVEAKDIVSDLIEFNSYLPYVSQIKPGVGLVLLIDKGITNHKVTLTGMGNASFKGHLCTIIKFESFFNPIDFSVPGVHFVGRSNRWGEIWIDQRSKVIVMATLKEDLLGELKMENSKDPMTMNILRRGTLETK